MCIVKEYRKYVRRRIDQLIHSKDYRSEIIDLILKLINTIRKIANSRAAVIGF
ncbi:MAG: hypothetical protein KGD58_15225 [Candidatus Lokiarchaeota archaeon]|nr:hypothetical protein [Candidatus Lokiarchaeota archaeon]